MSSTDPQVVQNITILLDTITGFYFVIGGSVAVKEGPSPASEAVIKSLPVVKIQEKGLECAICLDEFEVNGEAKTMTCKHRFHCGCLEKWLKVNGSCPVCRCKVVLEERESETKVEGGRRERRERGEMRIRFVNGEMVIDHGDNP